MLNDQRHKVTLPYANAHTLLKTSTLDQITAAKQGRARLVKLITYQFLLNTENF
jgi:hypothetical protein